MMKINSTCRYHPTKQASTYCQRCHKPICSTDLRSFERNRFTGLFYWWGGAKTETEIEHYCPICIVPINMKKWLIMGVIMLLFVVLAIFTPSISMDSTTFYTLEACWLIFIVVAIYRIIQSTNKILYYRREAKEFMNRIQTSSA